MVTKNTLTKLVLSALITLTPLVSDAQAPSGTPPPGKTTLDPLDPFDIFSFDELSPSTSDNDKTADELVRDAGTLLSTDRPLDARTKLLKAIQKDPKAYRAYYLLAGYYIVHVGHYRLALKYIKRAEALFEEQHGKPPYASQTLQMEHSNLIYYLSQVRLNLDNYQGALDALDDYYALGYRGEWYAGSRAWILMKLGRIPEAIKVARQGILAGAEEGRTLNMLGILLSMNDQPQESLEVFRQAIANELSMGREGQPATPLNNAGEVYKELFEDEKAESTFLRATSMPDGCEHVLPSLNLTLLYIDQLKNEAAISTMDSFQRCIAQFPLRNNEEHSALVNLARGRVDLHTGNVARAIQRFETALQGTQWFGKIGTNQNDLVVAASISLGQALLRQNNILSLTPTESWSEWTAQKKLATSNSLRAWWLFRRARQILIDDLNDVEDLTIRNTDSLLEYPTLGETLAGLSRSSLRRRLAKQREIDHRPAAAPFYEAYAAESERTILSSSASNAAFDSVIQHSRDGTDGLLRTHAILRRMETLTQDSDTYREFAYRIFYTAAPELRNYGLRLPVSFDSTGAPWGLRSKIESGPFLVVSGARAVCSIAPASGTTPDKISLRFTCPGQASKNKIVEGTSTTEAVNKLSDALFREEIRNVVTN
jgi:tetratricopeptide (TPR) repeat protein